MTEPRFRLLALDIDGTSLDPYGKLTPGVREAVGAARRRGLEVVLCTGRRFRTALPVARGLGLDGAIVVNNGVLVKDLASGATRHHAYLPREVYPEVVELARCSAPPLVYVDPDDETDFFTDRRGRTHPFQDEYVGDNAAHCRVVEDIALLRRDDIVMVSLMADTETLLELRERARDAFGDRVHTHTLINKNYRGGILEFLSPGSGKWTALLRLAESLGVAPEQIAAVGDDANDEAMIRGAGLGIAMANAVEEVRAAADAVVASNAEGGAIEAIERVLREAR